MYNEILNFFKQNNFSDEGAAALLGNLYKESKLNPKNLQDTYNKSINLSDNEYTNRVDNGTYKNFITDEAGYGIAQWTFSTRKEKLYNFIKMKNKSIGDLNAQLEFLIKELKEDYPKVYQKLKTKSSIDEISDYIMLNFENPYDKSEKAKQERRNLAKNFYQGGLNHMKYSKSNPPLICIMDNSTCYKGTSTMSIKGILWHSTGANNPYLKRYVQPSEHDPNYNNLIAKIGKNIYGNDWNHEPVQAGVNAWIGKLADESVTSIQTLPWNYKPWGCASGTRGSCNNGWIQFEICEDNLNNLDYFNKVYKEACELTAYLCLIYGLNPMSSISFNGMAVPTILCHQDSYQLGLGSNHNDIYHWFNKYGKTMEDVRLDVKKIMGNIISSPIVQVNSLKKGDVGDQVQALQENLIKLGFNCGQYGADGDFGNDTEAAVKKFQKEYNLTIDGFAGPEVQSKIKELISKNKEQQLTVKTDMYRVRKTWNDAKSQIGAYKILKNAQDACDKAGSGYSVFDSSGAVIYSTTINRTDIKPAKTYNDVMIGHSSKDENNNYRGGKAGDQTEQEVCIRTWYRGNWNVVMRPKDPVIAEKIAATMEAACTNNNIGYDQQGRNSLYVEAKKVNFDLSKINTPCECDCSSLVSICCIIAGLPEKSFYSGGNMMTTYTLKNACLSTGQFEALENSKYYAQKDYLKRGDILLYENGHTAIVLANGSKAEETTAEIFNQFLVRVTANVLNVRKGPDEAYLATTTVKKGQVFTIIDMEGEWGKLKSGAGWINLTYTSKL